MKNKNHAHAHARLEQNKLKDENVMRRRRITLKDGRYMIFYTFEGESSAPADEGKAIPEPQPVNEAEDEP